MRTPRSEIPNWLELTRSTESRHRRKALQKALPCEIKSDAPKMWERILQMEEDPDAHVRRWVVHTPCDGSPQRYREEIVKLLESRYHDSDDKVRKSVRRVLAGYRYSGNVNVL